MRYRPELWKNEPDADAHIIEWKRIENRRNASRLLAMQQMSLGSCRLMPFVVPQKLKWWEELALAGLSAWR